MFKYIIRTVLLFVPLLFFGCGSQIDDSDLVAKVGDAVLTKQEMKAQMAREGYQPDQEKTFVDRWIHRELLYQEALHLHLNTSQDLKQELMRIQKELLINKLLERTYKEKIRMTDEEIRSYYDQNISDFKLTEDDVRIQHILTETQSEASLALQEIQTGQPFESVAKTRSMDAFASQGGEMGYIQKGDVIPEVERWAFRLARNDVSRVFSSSFGYHIIKVIDKRSAGETRPLSEVQPEIMQRLRVIKEGQVYYDLLYQLQNQNKYYVFQPIEPSAAADSAEIPELLINP
ncbi:peptidylprolyl isomerase [bacterium]|nr:peptidylprolyl isomerase [bacterium]